MCTKTPIMVLTDEELKNLPESLRWRHCYRIATNLIRMIRTSAGFPDTVAEKVAIDLQDKLFEAMGISAAYELLRKED